MVEKVKLQATSYKLHQTIKPCLARVGFFCLVLEVGETGTPGSTNCAGNLDAERSEGACGAGVKKRLNYPL